MLLFGKMILAKTAMTIWTAPKRLFIAFMAAAGCCHNIAPFFHFGRAFHLAFPLFMSLQSLLLQETHQNVETGNIITTM